MVTFPITALPGESSQMPLTMDEISLLLTLVAPPKHQSWASPSKRHTWAHVLTTAFPVKGALVTWKFGRCGKQRFRERGSHTKPGKVCFHPYIPDLWSEPYGAICNPRVSLTTLRKLLLWVPSGVLGRMGSTHCWVCSEEPQAWNSQDCWVGQMKPRNCRAVEGVVLPKWTVVQDSRHGDATMSCRVGGGAETHLLWRRGKLQITETSSTKGCGIKRNQDNPPVCHADYTKDILGYEC